MADTNLDMDQARTYTIYLCEFYGAADGDDRTDIIDIECSGKETLLKTVINHLRGVANHAAIWHYPTTKFNTEDRVCIGTIDYDAVLGRYRFWDAKSKCVYPIAQDGTPYIGYWYDEEIDGCVCNFDDLGCSLDEDLFTIACVGEKCAGFLHVTPERARQLANLILDTLDGRSQ